MSTYEAAKTCAGDELLMGFAENVRHVFGKPPGVGLRIFQCLGERDYIYIYIYIGGEREI